MSNLNWVDYIFLAIFFFSMLAGFGRGFIREVVSLATLIAAFIMASLFASPLAKFFTELSSVQSIVSQASSTVGVNAAQSVSYAALAISYALIFIATIIAGTIIGHVLNIAFQTGILGFGNRILGAAFGLARGFIICLVVIFIVQLTPLGNEPWWHQSQIVIAFQGAVQWLGNLVSPALANLKARFGETIQGVGSTIQQGVGQFQGFGR